MAEMRRQNEQPTDSPGSIVGMFCFPPAGGNSSMYQDWARHLPPNVKVKGVELPGRQSRFKEPPCDRLARLVPALVKELKSWMVFPLTLFGHSLGALIAFEFARQMRREGLPPPSHLFVSSYAAPQLRRPPSFIHTLPEPLFLRSLGPLLPREVMLNRELLRVIMPTLRADFALGETYQYRHEPPLDCSITALGGAWDLSVRATELKMWQQQTTKNFQLHLFPGEHYYVRTVQDQLLETIGETLEQYAEQ